MPRQKLIFDESCWPLILEALEMELDKDKYLVNSLTQEHILDPNGEKIKIKDIILISKKAIITDIRQLDSIQF